MGFTVNDSRVRVDFFKPSGKWYGTGSIDMSAHYKGDIGECVRRACSEEHAKGKEGEWDHTFNPQDWVSGGGTIVVLEPAHENSHPIMIKQW
jgi:hypothetical protein